MLSQAPIASYNRKFSAERSDFTRGVEEVEIALLGIYAWPRGFCKAVILGCVDKNAPVSRGHGGHAEHTEETIVIRRNEGAQSFPSWLLGSETMVPYYLEGLQRTLLRVWPLYG